MAAMCIKNLYELGVTDELGIKHEIAKRISMKIESEHATFHGELSSKASEVVPDGLVEKVSLLGTSEDIIEKLTGLKKMVNRIAINPNFPQEILSSEPIKLEIQFIEKFAKEIIPKIK